MVMTIGMVDDGFNGAATCSLRNGFESVAATSRSGVLQWGRNLFVAECGSGGISRRPWGGFNGAATCSLRNGGGECPNCSRCFCFNGAATCSLRNAIIPVFGLIEDGLLQWGRNLFVAECLQRGAALVKRGQASMGPQLVRCGMPGTAARATAARPSFNGAATCSLRNACPGAMRQAT